MTQRIEILVLDDDPVSLGAIELALKDSYRVHGFTSPEAAERWLGDHSPGLAILDLDLGQESGLSLLRAWKERFPDLDILFCSGEVRVERAVECMRHGAADYVVKPFQAEDLSFIVRRTLEKRELRRRLETLNPLLHPRPVHLIGGSTAIQEIQRKVRLLKHQGHLNILILGESGTGKELVARQLHQQEEDSERPFVIANMPAIPASLMEAELFGVEKGAFTDAKASRAGKFEMAHEGDIFLDEIGDLAPDTQAKLLRTLQEKQVERVGGGRPRPVAFRAISATNQQISELVVNGRFREDLMYRLSDMVLWIPPLREHKEDIPELARHFIRKYSIAAMPPELSTRALDTLLAYHWPGNVRQLESTIKRALVFNQGRTIEQVETYDPGSLQPARTASVTIQSAATHEKKMAAYEKGLIENVLKSYGGDKNAAMGELGIPRATFYRRMAQLGIPLD